MAPTIKVGDTIPHHIFPHVPYTPALEHKLACGVAGSISTEGWKGKKVVIFSVPGAFTPTCHANHLPPYLQHYETFKEKGVDIIAVVSANDMWVMNGWLRLEGVQDKIIGLSDFGAGWSRSIGLDKDLTRNGLGIRTARYAMVLDDLIVKYIALEPGPGVTVSGAEAVLAVL